jgi:hypothetical protein
MFFPATCEVARYSVQAGLGRNLVEWRPISKDDFPSIKEWLKFEAGIYAGIGLGAEVALFIGGGLADANTFNGIFHTVQGALKIPGISGYVGEVDPDGRLWLGGTITVGPGIGLAKIDWMYQHHGAVMDLDDDFGNPGRCACFWMRKQFIGIKDALKYF